MTRRPVFASRIWGGFEGACHRRSDGRRVDSVHASAHDRWAQLDLAILRGVGVRTVRESLRWHHIEATAGCYDWASAQRQIDAARRNDVEVVWALCHWGVPDHLDVMAADWPQRLAQFAQAAARHCAAEGVRVAAWTPVNEIAFWSWAGGEKGGFGPYLSDQGDALKHQLMRGHLAAVAALRAVGANQPILLCEPLIHVAPQDFTPEAARAAQAYVDASFWAVETLLRADPASVDILGLNYYAHNQWRLEGARLTRDDAAYRPLRRLLGDVARRFPQLPLVISETGAEEPAGGAWLAEVARNVEEARRDGVAVEGICIYPILDYPGWENDRHCPCGLIGVDRGRRFVRAEAAQDIARLCADHARLDALDAARPRPR